METPNIFLALTPIPFLSVLIWILLIFMAMYLARKPFHRSMASLSRIIYNGLRLMSVSVKLNEKRMNERNRAVLLAAGSEATERKLEREFDRFSTELQKELEGFPQVQRKISEQLQKLEGDYIRCGEVPQQLPDWVNVIDAIANIKPAGDRMVIKMLEQIHHTLGEQHKAALEGHRREVAERHRILSHMQPTWHRLRKMLSSVEKGFGQLGQRSRRIDRYMDAYEKVRNHGDMAERQLSASATTRCVISAVVLAVAAIGAIINFNLIALPMSEMVGGASYIGGFKSYEVAGLFMVCLEIVIGIFLMDALRITRLFSIIGSMEESKRRSVFCVLLFALTILAVFESALAYRQHGLAANMEALKQSLSGSEALAESSWIPIIGQMTMGFILPFVMTFIAIPVESFISSGRTLLGRLAAMLLRFIAFSLRMLGNLAYYTGHLLVNIYDLVIFPGLWLEGVIGRTQISHKERTKADAALAENSAPYRKISD